MIEVRYYPNPFRKTHLKQYSVPAGTTLNTLIKSAAAGGFHPLVAHLGNGQFLLRASWDEPLPEGMQIDLHAVPADTGGGGGSNPLRTVAMIALMVYAPQIAGAMFPGATEATLGLARMGVMAVGMLAINKIMPPAVPASQNRKALPAASPTYTLTAANRLRPDAPIPELYGKYMTTPDHKSYPYSYFAEDDSNRQVLHQLLCISKGHARIHSIFFGNSPIFNLFDYWEDSNKILEDYLSDNGWGPYPNFSGGSVDSRPVKVEVLHPGDTLTLFDTSVIPVKEAEGLELHEQGTEFGPFVVNPRHTEIHGFSVNFEIPGLRSLSGADTANATISVKVEIAAVDEEGQHFHSSDSWTMLKENDADEYSFEITDNTPDRLRKTVYFDVEPGRYAIRFWRSEDDASNIAGNLNRIFISGVYAHTYKQNQLPGLAYADRKEILENTALIESELVMIRSRWIQLHIEFDEGLYRTASRSTWDIDTYCSGAVKIVIWDGVWDIPEDQHTSHLPPRVYVIRYQDTYEGEWSGGFFALTNPYTKSRPLPSAGRIQFQNQHYADTARYRRFCIYAVRARLADGSLYTHLLDTPFWTRTGNEYNDLDIAALWTEIETAAGQSVLLEEDDYESLMVPWESQGSFTKEGMRFYFFTRKSRPDYHQISRIDKESTTSTSVALQISMREEDEDSPSILTSGTATFHNLPGGMTANWDASTGKVTITGNHTEKFTMAMELDDIAVEYEKLRSFSLFRPDLYPEIESGGYSLTEFLNPSFSNGFDWINSEDSAFQTVFMERVNSGFYNLRDTDDYRRTPKPWLELKTSLNLYNDSGCTLLAMKITSSEAMSALTRQPIRVLAERMVPHWNPDTGTFDDGLVSSQNNLPDIAFEMLRSSRKIRDRNIDFPGIHEALTPPDGKVETFNAVFDQSSTLHEALNLVGQAAMSQRIDLGGKTSFARDCPHDVPTVAFGMHNIIQGTFSMTQHLRGDDSPDGMVVRYIDAANWRESRVTIPVSGGAKPVKPTEGGLFGCTDREHAEAVGTYRLMRGIHRNTTVSFETDLAAQLISPGKPIYVSHPLPDWGLSAEVVDFGGWHYDASRSAGVQYIADAWTGNLDVDFSIPSDDTEKFGMWVRLSVPVTELTYEAEDEWWILLVGQDGKPHGPFNCWRPRADSPSPLEQAIAAQDDGCTLVLREAYYRWQIIGSVPQMIPYTGGNAERTRCMVNTERGANNFAMKMKVLPGGVEPLGRNNSGEYRFRITAVNDSEDAYPPGYYE